MYYKLIYKVINSFKTMKDLIVVLKFIFGNQHFTNFICLNSRNKATKGYEKRWNELQQYFNSEPHLKEPGTSSHHPGPTPKVIIT